MGFLSFLPLIGDLASTLLTNDANRSAQRAANRANLAQQREQRSWEQQMSNTAVQRRADDIERAGGNRALAFVNGSEASTPSVTPARADPVRYAKPELATAIMQAAQLKQIQAQTKALEADARSKNVEANIREKLEPQETESRLNRFVEQYEWDNLKTEILRSQSTSSAAEAKRLNDSVDAAIAQAKQKAKLGELDVASAQRIAESFGLNQGATATFMRMIIDLLKFIGRKD